MCAGILLLGIVLLPAVCWLFVVGLAMILTGYSLVQKYRYRYF
jgi:hypothetical protein